MNHAGCRSFPSSHRFPRGAGLREIRRKRVVNDSVGPDALRALLGRAIRTRGRLGFWFGLGFWLGFWFGSAFALAFGFWFRLGLRWWPAGVFVRISRRHRTAIDLGRSFVRRSVLRKTRIPTLDRIAPRATILRGQRIPRMQRSAPARPQP